MLQDAGQKQSFERSLGRAHPREQDGGRHLSLYHEVTGKCHSGILLAHEHKDLAPLAV